MKKNIIIASVIAAIVLVLGGLYLWYANNYGNAKKIKYTPDIDIDYEWQSLASQNNITTDYMWARVKSLMIGNSEDGLLIPEWYMIEGRLSDEEAEESGNYRLSDQALLLKTYVRRNDRIAAGNIKNAVMERFDFETESRYETGIWLEAYLEYYSMFGKSADYAEIESLVSVLFDESGYVKPENISVAGFEDSAYQSVVDIDEEAGTGSLLGQTGESSSMVSFTATTLSSINLKLIKDLEANGLLPAGSFDSNLSLVLGGMVSDSIPLYAYACYVNDSDEVIYMYAHNYAASIDILESVRTMLNLAKVDSLPSSSYVWLKYQLINNRRINENYYFVTGSTDGGECVSCYPDVLEIACYLNDMDLFSAISGIEGIRVATYSSSPALSLIYRPLGDRYVFYAEENLRIFLIIS